MFIYIGREFASHPIESFTIHNLSWFCI